MNILMTDSSNMTKVLSRQTKFRHDRENLDIISYKSKSPCAPPWTPTANISRMGIPDLANPQVQDEGSLMDFR